MYCGRSNVAENLRMENEGTKYGPRPGVLCGASTDTKMACVEV